MPNEPKDLQKSENKEPTNQTSENIRTVASAMSILALSGAFFAWFYSLSPLLFIPLMAVAFFLVYYFLTVPKLRSLKTEVELLKETQNAVAEKPQPQISEKEEIPPEKLPVIQTRLVIDSVDSNKVESHIQLENIGKVVIKNIRVGFQTKILQQQENEPHMSRTLPANGKISVALPPNILKPNKGESLIVRILYNAEINGVEKEFLQKIRFLLFPKDIKVQTVEPEAWEESKGHSHVIEDARAAVYNQFTQTEGTMTFVFPETEKDGRANLVYLTNEFRSFSFDPVSRIVSLRTKTKSGRLISLDLPLLEAANKEKNHIILFMWDEKGGLLHLDNAVKRDPKTFGID